MTSSNKPPEAPSQASHANVGENVQIVETPVEARQGFLGRPVLVVLCASLLLAIAAGIILGMIRI